MLTRRVHGRELRLRPSPRINQIVLYVVAVMAQEYGMALHALIAMSNHWHAALSDPKGNIVDFKRDTHSFISRAVNAHHGDFESMWASSQTSKVTCEEPEDLIGKIAYAMANPVEARLVRFGHSWPGVRKHWGQREVTVKRPPKFFRGPEAGGKWPETVTLKLSRPPGYEDLSDDEVLEVVRAAIERREAELRREADRNGERFMGRKAVLAQSRYARPRTREPRFGISPAVAAKNKWRRIEALKRNKQWDDDYASALAQWRAGNREVLFPYGTYQMQRIHGVRCAPPPH